PRHPLTHLRYLGQLLTAMHRSARHSIAKTTLALNRTSLAIRSLCAIPVAHLQVPFFFPLIRQNLSLRTPITVILGIIDKLRAVILRAYAASFIRPLSLARLIHTGRDELDFPLGKILSYEGKEERHLQVSY